MSNSSNSVFRGAHISIIKSKSKINFVTAFNTFEKDSDHLVDQAIKCNIPTTEFKNGVVGYGADFFYKFRGINNNE